MTVLIFHSLWRELTYLLTCGRCSLVSGTQSDTVFSWITLWGMIILSNWLSLHFGSCCLQHFCCKFRPKLASHYIYKLVKKWSIVHQTVQTTFSKLKVCLSSIKKQIILYSWQICPKYVQPTVCTIKNRHYSDVEQSTGNRQVAIKKMQSLDNWPLAASAVSVMHH